MTTQSKNIGRNDPCPCGSGYKYKKCCMYKTKKETQTPYMEHPDHPWMNNIGLPPDVAPGEKPTQEMVDKISLIFQQKFRNSPFWEAMVDDLGEERANEILKEYRPTLK